VRPTKATHLFSGKDRIALLGEAAGFYKPSSARVSVMHSGVRVLLRSFASWAQMVLRNATVRNWISKTEHFSKP